MNRRPTPEGPTSDLLTTGEDREIGERQSEGEGAKGTRVHGLLQATGNQLREVFSAFGDAGADAGKVCGAGIAALSRVIARKCTEVIAHCKAHPKEVAMWAGTGIVAGLALPGTMAIEAAATTRVVYVIAHTSQKVREQLMNGRLNDVFQEASMGLWAGFTAREVMNMNTFEAWAMIFAMAMIMKTSMFMVMTFRKPDQVSKQEGKSPEQAITHPESITP